jgi:hypothetical protein
MVNRLPLALLLATASCIVPSLSPAQAPASAAHADSSADVVVSPASFDASAAAALQAMKFRAEELKIGGAAVLAYFEGDRIESWTSKMLVVGRVKDEPTATDKGSNLLAIAYAKAAEMADTLKNSGSGVRPPMTGEFGWQGGVIVRVKTGYVIAAFSGGRSEDDVAVSRAGMAKVLEEVAKAK